MARIPSSMTCLAVACLTSLTSSFGAPNTFAVNLGGMVTENSKTAESADASDTVKVMARGVGVDEAAALKDAYRDAVERAVGLYVDAETQVQNDTVVKDEILTQSNAYVTECQTVEKNLVDGLVHVRVMATVRKQQLVTKLRGVMPVQTVALNLAQLGNSHAQLESKDRQNRDAKALLKARLEGIDIFKSLFVASFDPSSLIVLPNAQISYDRKIPADKVAMRCLMSVRVDGEKYYGQFVPQIKSVLDQVALKAPKRFKMNACDVHWVRAFDGDPRDHDDDVTVNPLDSYKALASKRIENSWENMFIDRAPFMYDSMRNLLGGGLVLTFGPQSEESYYLRDIGARPLFFDMNSRDGSGLYSRRLAWKSQGGRNPIGYELLLVSGVNKAYTNWQAEMYVLDKQVFNVFEEWIDGLQLDDVHVGRSGGVDSCSSSVRYLVSLIDADGEEIVQKEWLVPKLLLLNLARCHYGKNWREETLLWYLVPFVGATGEVLYQYLDFVIDRDLLPLVKTVRIELSE